MQFTSVSSGLQQVGRLGAGEAGRRPQGRGGILSQDNESSQQDMKEWTGGSHILDWESVSFRHR